MTAENLTEYKEIVEIIRDNGVALRRMATEYKVFPAHVLPIRGVTASLTGGGGGTRHLLPLLRHQFRGQPPE